MFNDFTWTQKDALKNIQDSKKIGVWDLMLVVPCSNTNRAMKLLILGVGFFAWFQNFKLVKYLLCSFVSDCWISETKKNLKWNFFLWRKIWFPCVYWGCDWFLEQRVCSNSEYHFQKSYQPLSLHNLQCIAVFPRLR